MCGIVGAIAERNVTPILVEGLKRLEYRGYDSAGLAVNTEDGLQRVRQVGKVAALEGELEKTPLIGGLGIAHTRWATHGEPNQTNAHPHQIGDITLVHNGIIENYHELKTQLQAEGVTFHSDTDTEVVAALVNKKVQAGTELLEAVKQTIKEIEGAYGLGVIHADNPDVLVTARHGSPLVIGLGLGENFIASDVFALLPVTNRFIFLEDGDIAAITRDSLTIYDENDKVVEREEKESQLSADATDKGEYRHYMLKEIYEQARVIDETLEGRIAGERVLDGILGPKSQDLLAQIESVQIVACGTSYHAGLTAKYWFESIANVLCQVEVASEFRYRKQVVPKGTLFLTISQSGETADTLAALKDAKSQGYLASATICNVPESSLVRESDMCLMTRAGAEIGVASTKAFTTQLTALAMLVIALAKTKGDVEEAKAVEALKSLPGLVNEALALDAEIKDVSEAFADKHHALFLGRGDQYPIAMEGALKLKEISYIHAEAYAAGELKHGPLALVDADMPVIAVAPNNELLEKLKSNLQEVRARGGELFVFAHPESGMKPEEGVTVIPMPECDDFVAPILYTIPLQLLSYHVAVLKGTDVDQPRNLAKSVTVE